MPFGNEADKFAVFQHHQRSYVVFGHHFEGVKHRGIRMDAVNVVALLIEYRPYSSSGLTVLATCRLSRQRANQPADAMRLRFHW